MYELSNLLALTITASLNQPINYNPYTHGQAISIDIVIDYSRETESLDCIEVRGCGRRDRT